MIDSSLIYDSNWVSQIIKSCEDICQNGVTRYITHDSKHLILYLVLRRYD